MSPPTPVLRGSTAASVALAHIAASMALPPLRKIFSAAEDASGWLVQTMPLFARTVERPGHWPGRERRGGVIGKTDCSRLLPHRIRLFQRRSALATWTTE